MYGALVHLSRCINSIIRLSQYSEQNWSLRLWCAPVARLAKSLQQGWVGNTMTPESTVRDAMKNSTTCPVLHGKARFRHYGKFSPCDGENLKGVFGQFRPGAHLSACVYYSKHIVKPSNAQWLMPRGWATFGWWVSWDTAQDDTSRPVMFLSNHRTGKRCRSVTSNILFRVPGEAALHFWTLKSRRVCWSSRVLTWGGRRAMPCQELGRLRGRAAQTSRCQIWWSRSPMLDILQASDLDQMCHCGNCDLLTGSYCKSASSAQCAWVIWLCLKMVISSSNFWNPLSFVWVKIPHTSTYMSQL